jgi:hypothetical protein
MSMLHREPARKTPVLKEKTGVEGRRVRPTRLFPQSRVFVNGVFIQAQDEGHARACYPAGKRSHPLDCRVDLQLL